MSVCKYYFFLMEYRECVQVVSYIVIQHAESYIIYALCTYTLSMQYLLL